MKELSIEEKAKAYDEAIEKAKESVSDDLEEATIEYCGGNKGSDARVRTGFIMGAKWKFNQLEKKRLAACDRQTEEEAEIERDFVMGVIENKHRQPTFDDAIKYGMKLREEQMMAKAIDGDITFDYYGDGDKTYGCIAHNSFCLEDFGLKDGDKVKVIVIKED